MPRGSKLFVTFGIRPRRSSSLTPMYSNKTINKNKVRSEGIAMAPGISFPVYSWRICFALGYRTCSRDTAYVQDHAQRLNQIRTIQEMQEIGIGSKGIGSKGIIKCTHRGSE